MKTNPSRLLLLAPPALLLLVSLGACGSSPDAKGPATPARKIEACALLTEADATAALGEPVNAMSSVYSGAQRDPLQCAYNGGISDPPKMVSLLVRPSDSRASGRHLYEATRSGLTSLVGGSAPGDVAGLGEAAFWVGGQLDQLHVLKAELHLIITVQPGADPQHPVDAQAVAKVVAGKVLARL